MKTGEINFKFRRKARENVKYFPESSYTSADLAKAIFQSRNSQTLCEYHRKSKESTYKTDTIKEFTGMGFQGESVKFAADVGQAHPNHLHCGCPIDEVLLEYFFWKTLRVRSSNPDIDQEYAMTGLEKLKPCTRVFWNKSVRDLTGLETKDFISPDYGSPLYAVRNAMVQLHTQIQRLKALHAPVLVEVVFPPPDIFDMPAELTMPGLQTGVSLTGRQLCEDWKDICEHHQVSPLPMYGSNWQQ